MANILVCDDDREIVDAIEIYLSQDGHCIYKAYDGKQAIDLLKKEEIHLLIMDARVKSNLRRYTSLGSLSAESKAVYQVGGLVINDDTKQVMVDGEPVKMTPIEYNILLLLMKNQGRVFSIDQIYEQ